MAVLKAFMRVAIKEARISLQEGNCGFGAVIVKNGNLIAKAHDTEKTIGDATAHAEITAIQLASAELGRDLFGCVLISTHEPCPMCTTAIILSGIAEIAYGYSTKEAIKQGRNRIDISCKELFKGAGKKIRVNEALLNYECSVLYDRDIRDNIEILRGADEQRLKAFAEILSEKRLQWYNRKHYSNLVNGKNVVLTAYQMFLQKLSITKDQAPIVRIDDHKVIFHSKNFCPTLEACNILDIDTRFVCKHLTEKPTTDLIRKIHPKLRFTRNYQKLRPYTDYCEEMIILEE
jgi:tRNA(Arg) A34 adenosine deaminase TadA